MSMRRGRRIKEIDIDSAYREHVRWLESQVGQPVPLSASYTRGERPLLVSIEGETATVRFCNGAQLSGVPLRDLVSNDSYWNVG